MAHKVFISYAPEDKKFREELEKHLKNLKRQGLISSWHDGDIIPGTERRPQIIDRLNHADIILLLVSADYMSSDFCYSTELKQAIARHDAKQAHVIPILLRPIDYEGAPFSELVILPTNAKAVTQWPTHDDAFADVVQGIKKVLSATPKNDNQNIGDSVPTSNIPDTKSRSPMPITHTHVLAAEPASATEEMAPMNATWYENIPANNTSFTPVPPNQLEFRIPIMGHHFLDQQDREYLITTLTTIISAIGSINGIQNLLLGILPNQQIGRISFYQAPRNLAENIIGIFEPSGTRDQYSHFLGAFLKHLLENPAVTIGHDARIQIVALLFRYTLITDRQQIAQLSAQFQVPSPMLSDEQLINNPFSASSLSRDPKLTENLQTRFEALYHRRSYFLKINFLTGGAKAASSVCRIDFDMRGEGTGFLVAPDLILTNYHVMVPQGFRGDINARAQKCEVKFGVIEGRSTGQCFKLHPTDWRCAESKPEDLDFMLLRLDRPVTTDGQIAPLTLGQHTVQSDDFVNILQHPNGRSMEVSLRFNQVVRVDEKRIHYLADTEPGSSGSPVFNDAWELVAIHHAGRGQDEAGNIILANEGIPIRAIYERIVGYLK